MFGILLSLLIYFYVYMYVMYVCLSLLSESVICSVSDPVSFRPDPDPRFKKNRIRIPDPDPGSGSFKFCESISLVKGPAELDSTL